MKGLYTEINTLKAAQTEVTEAKKSAAFWKQRADESAGLRGELENLRGAAEELQKLKKEHVELSSKHREVSEGSLSGAESQEKEINRLTQALLDKKLEVDALKGQLNEHDNAMRDLEENAQQHEVSSNKPRT